MGYKFFWALRLKKNWAHGFVKNMRREPEMAWQKETIKDFGLVLLHYFISTFYSISALTSAEVNFKFREPPYRIRNWKFLFPRIAG